MSNTTSLQRSHDVIFGYDANMPMAWIGGVLFTCSALLHVYQYFKHRSWYLYLFLFGVFMEVAGYWTRVISIKDPENNAAVSSTNLLTTLAPSFLAGACYMTFGRIIYWVTPEKRRTFRQLWVPARFIALLFITLDFLSFFIQCCGIFYMIGSLTKSDLTEEQTRDAVRTTYDILRVGFVMQLAVFALFMTLAMRFMYASTKWKYDWPDGGSGRWRIIAWTTVTAACFITGRSLYRCLEFTLNRGDNYLRNHEWPFYLFDMVLIVLVLIAFNFAHPGRHIPQEYTTVRHAYKKAGFKAPLFVNKSEDDDQPAAGYSRVSLVPPPLNPPQRDPPPMTHVPPSSMNFSDPWNNRPSPGADRY